MKASLLAAAVLLLLLVVAPVAAAVTPPPPAAAAADATAIEFVTPSSLVAGIPTTLVVTLRDTATSVPVAGGMLSFDQLTTFGRLPLGNVTTNALGEAGVTWEPVDNGTYTITVAYQGNATYGATNRTLSLNVIGASSPPPPLLPPDRAIAIIVTAVVGGVWATYGFVAFLVLGIRTAGSRSEDEEESESPERETMEPSEREESTPKQRVPGIASANRAVTYLAISALILSGAAVVLLLSGGVAHSAAYTPSTIELQVTVVPDFRGAAWDSFVPDELVVHAGDTVKITVYNEDTMDHGFAIDALGVNYVVPAATQDNTTGDITPSVTLVTFTVTAAGAYLWYCTNPCGPGHTTMTGTLVVLPDD